MMNHKLVNSSSSKWSKEERRSMAPICQATNALLQNHPHESNSYKAQHHRAAKSIQCKTPKEQQVVQSSLYETVHHDDPTQ